MRETSTRTFTLLVGLSLVGAVGLQARCALAQGKSDTRSCAGLVVTADDQKPGRGGPVFSASEILDVNLRMVFPAGVEVLGGDVLIVDIETPNGFRYQRIEVPVAAAGSRENERRLAGYPFPVKVQQLAPSEEAGKKTQIVEVRLPVGGTAITDSGLYGQWKAEARLSGADPCNARFTLRP